jgi:hypothetical protein
MQAIIELYMVHWCLRGVKIVASSILKYPNVLEIGRLASYDSSNYVLFVTCNILC